MKAYASTFDIVSAKPQRKTANSGTQLIEIGPRSIPCSSVAYLSEKLGAPSAELLGIIGLPERTSARRRQEGFLKQDEAARLLRVGRFSKRRCGYSDREQKQPAG